MAHDHIYQKQQLIFIHRIANTSSKVSFLREISFWRGGRGGIEGPVSIRVKAFFLHWKMLSNVC